MWKHPDNGDGRVTHEVLPADLTRQPGSATGHQVKVTVAGLLSQCVTNCDVTYNADEDDLDEEVTIAAVTSEIGEETAQISGCLHICCRLEIS